MSLFERGIGSSTVSLTGLLEGDGQGAVTGESLLGLADYTDLVLSSGFPGVQHLSGRVLRRALDGYLDRIVDKDLEEAGARVRRTETIRGWLRAYAAATSTTATWESIRDAATPGFGDKPARSTTLPYVEALTGLRILDELPAWLPTASRLTKLAKSSKHHLVDPGLAARVLRVDSQVLLSGGRGRLALPGDGPLLGALFESLVTLDVRVHAQGAEASVSHMRTRDGHEVDLIVERRDAGVLAIEVKLARAIDDGDVKHLRWLRDKIGDQLIDAVVINTGPHAYRRRDGIAVVPLGLLGP